MRVALFFDGPNFYRNLEAVHPELEIDYDSLARWLVECVAGAEGELIGAWYHTGVSDQPALDRFLRTLELRPGYYVRRHRVVERDLACPRCGDVSVTMVEKGVDTAIAVDMVRMAARGILDRVVLLSGDEDMLPGVAAVQDLGRPVWLASWGGLGLSSTLRAEAFAHVDLLEGVEAFSTGRRRGLQPTDSAALPPPSDRERVLKQVQLAAAYFAEKGGHLSRWYFVHRWAAAGDTLPVGATRQDAVEELLANGRIEEYQAQLNGRLVPALRPVEDGADRD